MKSMKNKLIEYCDAGFPIVYIDTYEDEKTDNIIAEAFNRGFKIEEWNGATGHCDFKNKNSFYSKPKQLDEMLHDMLVQRKLDKKILVLKDIGEYFKQPNIVSLLKQIAYKISVGGFESAMIIIVSPVVVIPSELEKYITVITQEYIGFDDITKLINKFINEQSAKPVSSELVEQIAIALKGLTEFEINNILALAYSTNGDLTKKDLQFVYEQKQQMVMKSGILEMIPVKENINDIGGLENLKTWLKRKGMVFNDINKAKAFGVDMPKGILIAGVPGCGKSLTAKATASIFEVPLLRLDMGRLMGKYVGESESNMRKAIALADAISPCILWIDELEKAFAGIGGDGGNEVTTRLFGTFLTWMQEKTTPTFVLATANNITKLPPELLRKGRFDEIFYVGLPNPNERKKIFEVHISKRRKNDLAGIDIQQLVSKSDGFSGADIEGVVRDGIENAFCNRNAALTTNDIMQAIEGTTSLSEIMKDDLKNMADEYKKRGLKNASV